MVILTVSGGTLSFPGSQRTKTLQSSLTMGAIVLILLVSLVAFHSTEASFTKYHVKHVSADQWKTSASVTGKK